VGRCSPCGTAPKGPDLAGNRRRDSCAHLTEYGATTIWERPWAPPALVGDAVRERAGDGMDRVQLLDTHKVAEIDHLHGLGESAALIGR
jgi:hypothetical protein